MRAVVAFRLLDCVEPLEVSRTVSLGKVLGLLLRSDELRKERAFR